MNVFSAFDGMGCGRIALDELNVPVDRYFASEIDKSAMGVANKNYPDIIQLGDIEKVDRSALGKIDLFIGGSPCQGFSFAGKMLNFDDPRSKLFFTFVDLLNKVNPSYFLLENVRMKKEHQNIISEYLGVEPIFINSATQTAHDRKRLYWTNIPAPATPQPENPKLYLKDVLEDCPHEPLFLKPQIAKRYTPNPNFILDRNKSCVVGKLSKYQGDRVFDVKGKASSLSASGGNNGGGGCNIIHDPATNRLRRLSVVECEKLQGVPVGFTTSVSDHAAYKMLGNGWSVPVIKGFFSNIPGNRS